MWVVPLGRMELIVSDLEVLNAAEKPLPVTMRALEEGTD